MIRRYNDFISQRMSSGRTLKQARNDYKSLKADGVSNIGKWHAQRFSSLKDKSFIRERERKGVSREQAKSELNRVKSEGKKPSRWLAQRLKPEIRTIEDYSALLDGDWDFDTEEWTSSVSYGIAD